MNENTQTTESMDLSAFDEGYDGGAATPPENEPEGAMEEGETTPDTDLENQQGGTAEETQEPQSAEEQTQGTQEEPENQQFTLKHLGQDTTVSREKVIELAQKGLDYERIRGQRDDLNAALTEMGGLEAVREAHQFLTELAQGGSISDLMARARVEMDKSRARDMAAAKGISEEEAARLIDIEKREKALREAETAKSKPDPAQERVKQDVAAFQAAYPDKRIQDVPAEVWAQVKDGKSLTDAYAAYTDKQSIKALTDQVNDLKHRLAAAEQNAKNAQRAAPTAKSAGAGAGSDPFLDGWGN